MNAQGNNSTPSWSRHLRRSDLHGVLRLGVSAAGGAVDLVEEWHMTLLGRRLANGIGGRISGFAYGRVRAWVARAGQWVDCLPRTVPAEYASSVERDAILAALNGFLGDWLADSGNPLAIPMQLRHAGRTLQLDKASLSRELPHAGGKLLVLVHGLGRSDAQWRRNGHDHGAALAQSLGYTPVYLFYNTGRHISQNGREFAQLMDALVAAWPVKLQEIAVIGHSMGGLVARSACHYAGKLGCRWLRRLRHLVFLGSPHHGAPLERHGNWLTQLIGRTALIAPIARLARLRSAGITDLRYGSLLDEDWHGRDRFAANEDQRTPVPLPAGVHCYTVAGTTGRRQGDFRDRLLGDGVIPLDTALGRHDDAAHTLAFPDSHRWIAFGVHHLDLLSNRLVSDKLESWLAESCPSDARSRQRFRRPPRKLRDASTVRTPQA